MLKRLGFILGLAASVLLPFSVHAEVDTNGTSPLARARLLLQGADRLAVNPGLRALVQDLPASEFPALVAELRSIPVGLDRREPGKIVFEAWARQDGPTAFATALRGPLAPTEAAAALQAWVTQEPEAPIVFIQDMKNPDEKALAAQFLAHTWLKDNPARALRQSDALPDAAMRAAAMRFIVLAMSQNPEPHITRQAAAWISRHTQADYAAEAAGIIAANWIIREPRAATAWVEKLSPGPVQNQAIYELAGSWSGTQPEAAHTWLQKMPPSEGKNRALDYLRSSHHTPDSVRSSASTQASP
jgi:hypothetical protein